MARKPGRLHSLTESDWTLGLIRRQWWILHIRWYDYISNDEVLCRTGLLFIHRSQTKAWIIRTCCQTRWWCYSKTDPWTCCKVPDGVQTSPGWRRAQGRPPGFIRSAGTKEFRWLTLWSWHKTDRSSDISQWRDATVEHFMSWWWGLFSREYSRKDTMFQSLDHLGGSPSNLFQTLIHFMSLTRYPVLACFKNASHRIAAAVVDREYSNVAQAPRQHF